MLELEITQLFTKLSNNVRVQFGNVARKLSYVRRRTKAILKCTYWLRNHVFFGKKNVVLTLPHPSRSGACPAATGSPRNRSQISDAKVSGWDDCHFWYVSPEWNYSHFCPFSRSWFDDYWNRLLFLPRHYRCLSNSYPRFPAEFATLSATGLWLALLVPASTRRNTNPWK